jgi:hypothetical protein
MRGSMMSKRNILMDILYSEKGVVIVITLVLAAIALAISTTAIYMVTQRITLSGIEKRYSTALAAAKGSVEITKKYINLLRMGYTPEYSECIINDQSCLTNKLQTPTSQWDNCDDTIICTLGSYRVTIDLVDTIEGNTGTGLSKVTGVVNTKSLIPNPSPYPYIYRIFIQSQKISNPIENARITILYAY